MPFERKTAVIMLNLKFIIYDMCLTFAPEAGTQRMRDVINKGLTEEVILHGAMEAFKGGWSKVKLYFMMGLPTETEEDIKGNAILIFLER